MSANPDSASLADVQYAFDRLLSTMDAVLQAHDRAPVEEDPPTTPLKHADWAYQRCGAVGAMIRSRSAGTAPAALARGLLEEAAFWDWALATDASSEWARRLALAEYERLKSRADPEDCIWLQWVLAPGVELGADGDGLPQSTEVVKRLGHGFEAELLAPLSIGGLFGVYRLIELITHGAAATAMLFDRPDGCEMADEVAAAVLHVSGAGAAAVVLSWLPCDAHEVEAVAGAAKSLADVASLVHRFPMGPRSSESPRNPGDPGWSRRGTCQSSMSYLRLQRSSSRPRPSTCHGPMTSPPCWRVFPS